MKTRSQQKANGKAIKRCRGKSAAVSEREAGGHRRGTNSVSPNDRTHDIFFLGPPDVESMRLVAPRMAQIEISFSSEKAAGMSLKIKGIFVFFTLASRKHW